MRQNESLKLKNDGLLAAFYCQMFYFKGIKFSTDVFDEF